MKNKRDTEFLTQSFIAHRGLHNINENIPENTLKAFKNAIKNNYAIELDVHILKDGKVIVFHDKTLFRMTGVNKKIKDMNYDEIKCLKLKNTSENIPLLKEVLKLVAGKVPLIIELKSSNKVGTLEKEVMKLLENYNGKFAIKSFNPFSLLYIKKYFPEVIRGQLSSDFKNKNFSIIKKIIYSKMPFNFITKPDFISYDIKAFPNKRIAKLRKNIIIIGWTVRSIDDLKYAKKYCDNFIFEKVDINLIKNYL